jgi:hypothetical protein
MCTRCEKSLIVSGLFRQAVINAQFIDVTEPIVSTVFRLATT